MLLSIIIPLFNAEHYIEQCLLSVIEQEFPAGTCEILVINDGSTDSSPTKVEKMVNEFPVIKLINQENKGNGAARNTGLDHAEGKYIYFLDADDYVAKNSLGAILKLANENDLDVIGFGSKIVNDSKDLLSKDNFQGLNIAAIYDGYGFIGQYDYRAEIWWYITKNEVLKSGNLRFYDRKFVQDSYFTPRVFLSSKRISFLPLDIHRYRKSHNSITRKKNSEHVKRHLHDMLFSVEQLDKIIHDLSNDHPDYQACFARLQSKKQRYAFLIFTRIIQADLNNGDIDLIKVKLTGLGAYPIGSFTGQQYPQIFHDFLRLTFNNWLIFKGILRLYRMVKG